MTDDEILAGAKFYARAYLIRAVHGVIPNWDDEADNAEWERTPLDRREEMLDMVRGIIIAAEFKRRHDGSTDVE